MSAARAWKRAEFKQNVINDMVHDMDDAMLHPTGPV